MPDLYDDSDDNWDDNSDSDDNSLDGDPMQTVLYMWQLSHASWVLAMTVSHSAKYSKGITWILA